MTSHQHKHDIVQQGGQISDIDLTEIIVKWMESSLFQTFVSGWRGDEYLFMRKGLLLGAPVPHYILLSQ